MPIGSRSAAAGNATKRNAANGLVGQGVWLLILFCIQMPLWWTLSEHNTRRTLAARAEIEAPIQGADVEDYVQYFRVYPESVIPGSTENVFQELSKRPLFPPIFIAFNWTLSQTGFEYPARMYVFLAFFASSCSVSMCKLLLRENWSPLQSVLGSLVCTFSFSWLSMFSIPETYSLAVLAAIFCLLSGQRLSHSKQSLSTLSLQHAVIVGLASWAFLPLSGGSLLVLSAVKNKREVITIVLPVLVIAVTIALVPLFVTQFGGLRLDHSLSQVEYTMKYHSSLSNLTSIEWWRDVSTVFLFFSFVAPVQDFVTATGRPDWTYIASSWPTIIVVLGMVAAYCLLLASAIAGGLTRQLLGVGVWLGILLLFFIVFNPKEVLLYASLPATLVVYCSAVVLGHEKGLRIAEPAQRTISSVALALAGILLLCLNLPAILGS